MQRTPSSDHDNLAYRLTQILARLNQGEKLDPAELAITFNVHARTIQRDLKERFAFLPLEKKQGRYHLPPSSLGKLSLRDIDNFAGLAGVRGLFPSLSNEFLRDVFDSRIQSPLLVKGHHYEDLRGKEEAFSLLEAAITQHSHIEFDYFKPEGLKSYALVEPYKLINHDGIWYLAGKDGDQLKSWAFSKIEHLQTLDNFTPDAKVHDTLAKEDGIWLNEKKIEVVLKVSHSAAGYFRRRSLIAHQVIEKELEGGGLIVSCKVAHTNQILPIVRYWLPNIRVISPEGYQDTLESELKTYLACSCTHS